MWIKSEIFDENGKHLDRGLNLRPQYHVMISTGSTTWRWRARHIAFLEYDLGGRFLYSWGLVQLLPRRDARPRQVSVDSEGNV